jgi:3-phosphoshikimate 1-carboxyvinyltransferase
VLEKMGCNVEYMPGCIRLRAGEHLRGVSADMNGMPDMAPTLAVTALFADSPSRIRNVSNLRIKESDRIRALCLELKKLGAGVIEHEDGLEIFPERNYRKAVVETYNDHRIAMSFSIAGLKIDGLEIVNPACVTKTFPDFFRFFGRIFNNSPEF